MSPQGGGPPPEPLNTHINNAFGSFDNFVSKFTESAVGHFGSGWVWLVQSPGADGTLQIVSTHDADNPLKQNLEPLLVCDVWEHAYYIDYRNARKKYVESWFKIVNWNFAIENLQKSGVCDDTESQHNCY